MPFRMDGITPISSNGYPQELKRHFELSAEVQPQLLAKVGQLRQCLCHGDYYSKNLLQRRTGERFETVALDWAFTGYDCYGSDAGQLFLSTILFNDQPHNDWRSFFDACVSAYTAGLHEGGWNGDPRRIRFGAGATAILRFGAFGIVNVFSMLVSPLPWLQGPEEEVNFLLAHHTRLSEFLLGELLPEMLELAEQI